MRIEQLNGKVDSVVVDSSAMDTDEAQPPDISKKKMEAITEGSDKALLVNGNSENGLEEKQINEEDEMETDVKDDSAVSLNDNSDSAGVTDNGNDGGDEPVNGKQDQEVSPHRDSHKKAQVDASNRTEDAEQSENDNDINKGNGECKIYPSNASSENSQKEADTTKARNNSLLTVLNGEISKDNVLLRRSSRTPQGPSVDNLIVAAKNKAKTSVAKPSKVIAPTEKKAQKNTNSKVLHLTIDDRKEPEEAKHMRAMAKVVFGIGLDLAKQMVYKDLIRVQGKRDTLGQLDEKEREQLKKLRKRHDELCKVNRKYSFTSNLPCSLASCEFRTDSIHRMNFHLEEPHRIEGELHCSFCRFTTKIPNVYADHVQKLHGRKPHNFYRPGFLQCNMCNMDCPNKTSLCRHKMRCEKKFSLKRNLSPYYEVCDIPIKKMFVPKPPQPPVMTSPHQPLIRPIKSAPKKDTLVSKQIEQQQLAARMRLKQQAVGNMNKVGQQPAPQPVMNQLGMPPSVPQFVPSSVPNISAYPQNNPVPQTYAIGGNLYTLVNNNGQFMLQAIQQPQRTQPFAVAGLSGLQPVAQPQLRPVTPSVKPIAKPTPPPKSAANLEICEICGGFVKDRESLRVHFYWAHKIDIRKDVFSRKNPSLSCDHCPEKFWTFQGYDRHRKSAHKNLKPSIQVNSTLQTKPIQCPLCRCPSTHIMNHLLSVHNVSVTAALEKKQCTICLISFPTVQEVEEHLIHLHGFSFIQNMAKSQSLLRNTSPAANKLLKAGQAPVPVGLFAHSKQIDPTCTICNISFAKVQDFTNHCNRYHIFKCYRCGCRWNTYALLVRHLSEAHFDAQDQCIICKGKFTAGIPFIQHMLTSHIKGLSVRVKRLSSATINSYTKRKRRTSRSGHKAVTKSPVISLLRTPISPRTASKQPAIVIDANESPTKEPIILRIDDNDGNETIEIHENPEEDVSAE